MDDRFAGAGVVSGVVVIPIKEDALSLGNILNVGRDTRFL